MCVSITGHLNEYLSYSTSMCYKDTYIHYIKGEKVYIPFIEFTLHKFRQMSIKHSHCYSFNPYSNFRFFSLFLQYPRTTKGKKS